MRPTADHPLRLAPPAPAAPAWTAAWERVALLSAVGALGSLPLDAQGRPAVAGPVPIVAGVRAPAVPAGGACAGAAGLAAAAFGGPWCASLGHAPEGRRAAPFTPAPRPAARPRRLRRVLGYELRLAPVAPSAVRAADAGRPPHHSLSP
jgi:hypothetical protein